MPLVLAIKNRNSIVVASDVPTPSNESDKFGQLMSLPNHCVLMMAGNLEGIRTPILKTVLPRIIPDMGAAGLARLIQAAMVLEIVPNMDQFKGRVEIIVAGIDPIRHVEKPGLYYMDSAQEFNLEVVTDDAIAAGSTAAVTALTTGHDYADSSAAQLQVLAKECLAATKMRWPTALQGHVGLGVISAKSTQLKFY